ncbi:MAG: hypothetical protein VB144_03360 [Clostridia bacterium]|nr:hypothetical protein [Clostridia bacterium]
MKPASIILKDLPTKLLALALALAIWMVAMGEKQRSAAVQKFDISIQATVVARNVPEGLIVTSPPSVVALRLRGPKELESATAESAGAVINLAGKEAGQHVIAVEPEIPNGVELVRASDSRVTVTLERRVSVAFPVEAAVLCGEAGLPAAAGAEQSAAVSAVPAEVTVEGPESTIGRVARAVAVVKPPETVATVILLDSHGQALSGLAAYPATVTVSASPPAAQVDSERAGEGESTARPPATSPSIPAVP